MLIADMFMSVKPMVASQAGNDRRIFEVEPTLSFDLPELGYQRT